MSEEVGEDEDIVLSELSDILKSITVKNHREYYHDALQHREELFSMFDLGFGTWSIWFVVPFRSRLYFQWCSHGSYYLYEEADD